MKSAKKGAPSVQRFYAMAGVMSAGLLALGAGGARGEDAAPELKRLSLEDLMKLDVKEVTTASKRPEKETEAPGMVYVIDKNDIRLRGYSQLKDVLKDLPGMETVENNFSEFGTLVAIRGIAGNNKIVLLVNGMRVNPPGGEDLPIRSDISIRNAEQIEVVYGPGSTLYGRDAVSAVINIKTKEPGESLNAEADVAAGLNNARDLYGSFGQVFNKDHNVSLSGYVQYHDSDLTRLDKAYPDWWRAYQQAADEKGGVGAVPSRQDFGLNAFTRFEAGDFSLQGWFRDSRRSSAEGYAYPPVLSYLPQAIWQDSSLVVEAKDSTQINSMMRLDSTLTYNRYEIDPDTRYTWPLNATTWNMDDYKYGLGSSLSLEETLRVDFSKDISLVAGLVASTYDVIPKSTVPGGASPGGNVVQQGGDWVYYETLGGPAIHVPRVVEVKYQEVGGYLEGNWQALSWLKFLGGVRSDWDSRVDGMSFTPRVGVVANLTPEFTAKYTFSTAYVAPPAYFENATYDNGTLLAVANPDLKPEKSMTHEVDFNYTEKNYQLGLALYHGNQENLFLVSDNGLPQNIIRDVVYLSPTDPTQTRELAHSVNGGDSYNEGADLYGRATFGAISPWASYSVVRFEETENGVTTGLPGISQHNGRLGVSWAVTSRFSLTPSLVIRSKPKDLTPYMATFEDSVPYEINLYALWALSKNIEFFADLRNITDHRYILTSFAGGAAPQETFNGMVGVKFGF
jgi:outer membrane receptor for ferrienterochelin and colicin